MKKKLLLIIPLFLLATSSFSFGKYYCKDLCKQQAQELLAQWHWYLDRDNDWSACESSPRCSWYSSSYTQKSTVVNCSSNECKLWNTCHSKPGNSYCAWYWWDARLCNEWYYESWYSCIKKNEPTVEKTYQPTVSYQAITQVTPKYETYTPTTIDADLIEDVEVKINWLSYDAKKSMHQKIILILPSLDWRNQYILTELSNVLAREISQNPQDLSTILWDLFWDEETTNNDQIINQNVNNIEAEVVLNQEPIMDWWVYLVSSVIDWDTVKLRSNWEDYTVRLIWIDSTERWEDYYEDALDYLSNRIRWKEVVFNFDPTQAEKDRYERYLGYISLDWWDIWKEMIISWFAKEYTYNKPYKYQSIYISEEENAKATYRWIRENDNPSLPMNQPWNNCWSSDWWTSLQRDYCPDWDNSYSYYDCRCF